MSALKDRLSAAGLRPELVAFDRALALFLNNGGTIAEARARVEAAAERMPGGGQFRDAEEGQMVFASARRQDGDAADAHVPKGHSSGAASPHEPGRGHAKAAEQGQKESAAPRPGRPSAAHLSAAARVAKQSARAVSAEMGWLANATIPGGPPMRDLRWRDLRGMARRQIGEAATHGRYAIALMAILKEGEKRLGQPDPDSRWIDDLPAEAVRKISAETEADVLRDNFPALVEGLSRSVQLRLVEPQGGPNE